MGENSAISWTNHSFNPWWGCVKVSPACQHCYAETFSKRVGEKVWGPDSERRFFGDKHWNEPLKWNRKAEHLGQRQRVFCASMSDVFEDRADLVEHRERLFKLIDKTPSLDWLLLTKRPENIARLMPASGLPLNVWMGTTVENDAYAQLRLPHLVAVSAVVRFISYEPALGPIDIRRWADDIDWIIAGGESGVGFREPDIEWMRDIRDQCVSASIWFHFKQWGGLRPKAKGRMLDGREWNDIPPQSLLPRRGKR